MAWQGDALLPFVDEKRLKRALKPLRALMTEEESMYFHNLLHFDLFFIFLFFFYFLQLRGTFSEKN